MSLEDLDKVIADSDPQALGQIEGVRKIADEIGQPLEIPEVESYSLDTDVKKFQGFKALFKLKATLFWIWLKNLSVENFKKTISWSVEKKQQIQQAQQKFKYWPTKSRLLLQGAVVVSIGIIIFSYFAFIKKTLVYKQELFMTSFEEMADEKWDLSKTDSSGRSKEYFYNSSRIPKNIFKLKKIVVNIQPSENSGSNPMVAFEFSLEGSSSEALLEIKDREGEILDLVQRTVESQTFDELNEINGKKMISDKVKVIINQALTLGKIRQVYIQGIILKP